MKKTFLFLLLALFSGISATAQQFKFGVETGATLNRPPYSDLKAGVSFGAKVEMTLPQLGKGWYAETAVGLRQQRWNYRRLVTTAVVGAKPGLSVRESDPCYLYVPLRIGRKFDLATNVRLYAKAGAYFGYGLFGKTRHTSQPIDGSESMFFTETKVFGDSEASLARYQEQQEWGTSLQMGVELCRHFQIGLGYDHAFSDFQKMLELNNRLYTLSVSYLF